MSCGHLWCVMLIDSDTTPSGAVPQQQQQQHRSHASSDATLRWLLLLMLKLDNAAPTAVFGAVSKDTYKDICKYAGIMPMDEQIYLHL